MGKRFFKQTVRDIDLERQTVLVRVDYNVPLSSDGSISDDLRIRASLPTLEYLLESQCKLVIISHLGRPEGRDEKLSLAPVAARLSELLGRSVMFVDDCVGDKVRQVVRRAPCGSVILLENLRYYPEEEADDMSFAKQLAKSSGAAFFVQDAFGAAHRAHASTRAITLILPSFAGLLLEKEHRTITKAMQSPARPFTAIVGGAKISDKIELIKRFIDIADTILVGGAMANNFLRFKGLSVGRSKVEEGQDSIIKEIYDLAAKKVGSENVDNFIVLPQDVAIGASFEPGDHEERREVSVDEIGADDIVLDIGAQTIDVFCKAIEQSMTVVWNGTLGLADVEIYSYGSARTSLAIASNGSAMSIVGGGDTVDFVLKWGGNGGAGFDHMSTGGGASLELMSGKELPGIESLLDASGLGVVN